MRTRESSLLLLSVAVNISVFLCINNKYHCVRGNVQIEEWQFRDGQYCYLALLLTADFVKNHKRKKLCRIFVNTPFVAATRITQ